MPHLSRDPPGRLARRQHHRGERVPRLILVPIPHPGPIECIDPDPSHRRIRRPAHPRTVDEHRRSAHLRQWTHDRQRLARRTQEVHSAAPRRRFRLLEYAPHQGAANPHRTRLEIHVLPVERHLLGRPQTGPERELEPRPRSWNSASAASTAAISSRDNGSAPRTLPPGATRAFNVRPSSGEDDIPPSTTAISRHCRNGFRIDAIVLRAYPSAISRRTKLMASARPNSNNRSAPQRGTNAPSITSEYALAVVFATKGRAPSSQERSASATVTPPAGSNSAARRDRGKYRA